MVAHTGLQGAALWIVLFRSTGIFCTWQFDLQGSSLMLLFFELSGVRAVCDVGSDDVGWLALALQRSERRRGRYQCLSRRKQT